MIYISKVWNFFKGYVIISIKGYNIERLINKAVRSGITIKSVTRDKNKATLTIDPTDFKTFCIFAKSYDCKIHISHKNGLFRTLTFAKRNIPYIVGIFVAILFMFAMTQRVWTINIDGVNNLNKADIINSCHKMGLYEGCNKNKPDYKQIAENIKLEYKTISWINISLKGSVVHIKLSEERPKSTVEVSKNSSASAIVSLVDAQISYIVTNNGTPLVKKGDVVKSGDVLISPQLKPSGNEETPVTDLVNARGSVRGIVKRTYGYTIPFKQNNKKYTDNIETIYGIKIFDKTFMPKANNKFKLKDSSETIKHINLGKGCPLPIYIYKETHKEYILIPVKIDEKTAKKLANQRLIKHIVEDYDISSDVLSVNMTTNKTDTGLAVGCTIISDENIAKSTVYENLGGNTLNGTKENSDFS